MLGCWTTPVYLRDRSHKIATMTIPRPIQIYMPATLSPALSPRGSIALVAVAGLRDLLRVLALVSGRRLADVDLVGRELILIVTADTAAGHPTAPYSAGRAPPIDMSGAPFRRRRPSGWDLSRIWYLVSAIAFRPKCRLTS